MNNSKLINVLRTFSKNEMKEFEKFISSPFFNGGRNYIPFLNQLKKFYPVFDDEKLTPEYVYSKLYPGKEFNKQIIWNLTSSLLNLVEEYLMYVSIKKNKFIREHQIAEEFWDRKLTSYYYKKLNDLEATLDKMGLEDNYFRYKTQLEKGKISYYFLEDAQHLLFEHIVKEGEYTILAFMKDISDVIGSLHTSYTVYNTRFEDNLSYTFIENLQMEKIIEYSYEHNFTYAPILEMYYRMIMLVIDEERTEHFYRLKELFEQNFNLFPYAEKYTWITELSNYCIVKLNRGDNEFRKICFELDKFRLREGLLFQGKYMPKLLFVRIVSNATFLYETEWAKKYIEEYIHLLKPAYQKPTLALSYATLYFKLKDYDKVMDNLSKVKFMDLIDKVYVKSFYLKTYYELNEIETLLNYIDSTKHFFNKNISIGSQLKENYIRFTGYLYKLVMAKENNDEFEIDKLLKTVRNDLAIPNGEWLLEKIEEVNHRVLV
ncbi:MAG: hypothetical protein EHM58_03635 [Ignavibacteriae bacterium]|nr:MAG: hypothetical protein EHM58_03635 [Ignavibacteriota bacterium]